MKLRAHQELAVEMLRGSLRAGNKRPLLAAPCSFGKTLTAAYILSEAAKKGKRGIFFCDRIKLVQQSVRAFVGMGLDIGVMQGNHEMTNFRAPIQIASIQTAARRKRMPEFDIAIVDECHTHYQSTQKMMDAYNNVPFIGLSATPYSKGLGEAYDDLLVPITPQQLLDQEYLCPVDYYGGAKADLSKVKTRAIPTGGTDYDPSSLAEATENDTTLTGDIIKNWVAHADGMQTIAFTPSINHSKELVRQFQAAGISAEHIDGYMADDQRQELFDAHDKGEFLILSCSRLLNTGYDAPGVQCLIDAFPTKSLIAYVQRGGRIQRTAPGKTRAIYLDHAGNVSRFGFCETIVPDSLDDGSQKFSERNQIKEKKEPKVRQCPQCYQEMMGMRCKCGYEIPIAEQLETTDEMLVKLTPEQRNRKTSGEDKAQFYSELIMYGRNKGYKEGWASNKYRERFGVFPNKIKPHPVNGLSDDTRKFITSGQIRYAKRRVA